MRVASESSEKPRDSEHPADGAARQALAGAVQKLPAPLRAAFWRSWWDLKRLQRHRAEARGDHSQSFPALHGMDRKLATHLDTGRPGFFVEAGANDGYHQSNTYMFERLHGWRGVMVEPVPLLFRRARRERRNATVFNCALVPMDFPDPTVKVLYGGMMTTVAGTRESLDADRAWARSAHQFVQEEPEHEFDAPARTLSSLLDEVRAPEVDLLSLDVEGFEVQVLQGLDLSRHAPRWVLIEIREGGTSRESIEAVLGDRYVYVENLSPFDILYRREDVVDRASDT